MSLLLLEGSLLFPFCFLFGGRTKHVLFFWVKCVFLLHVHAFEWRFSIANSCFLVYKKIPAAFPKFTSNNTHYTNQNSSLPFYLEHSGEQMSMRQIVLERVSWDMRVRLKLSKFFWTYKLRVGMSWGQPR